ncbi:MAG: DUF3445 domain-containing protein [Leptolyngbyaceae cyanobacterium SL_7_1]|nr:DUF3445 domain-containing protein [Leptolyngbyaceae cyanobacterium SL_7_1]
MMRPKYLPFMDGWRLALGLKPLAFAEWIEIDQTFVEQVTLKHTLLTERHNQVFASLPGSQVAQQEVLDTLVAHLLEHFPQYYQRQGDRLYNTLIHQSWNLNDFKENPLDLAGRLVQEDLCLMLPSDRGYSLSAASVCFPSRWRLQEKMGQPITSIHEHIPDYPSKLERPVDQFFDRLKVEHPGYRLNWSLVDTPKLFLADAAPMVLSSQATRENLGKHLWLRVERQTLRRMPISDTVLFTIRSYLHPLEQLVADRDVAEKLAIAIQQMPAAMQAYKSISPVRSMLLEYLEQG